MTGTVRKRSKNSWTVILDFGFVTDPETGKRRRKQRWFAVKGTKASAREKLNELLGAGEIVEPTKMTVSEWLDHWLKTSIEGRKKFRTVESYTSIVERHLKPAFGALRLPDLTFTCIEDYYAGKRNLSPKTLLHHHVILSSAMKEALKKGLLRRNPCSFVSNRPNPKKHDNAKVRENCWTPQEARAFLEAAKGAGPQAAAFYRLALDSGMRKGELCGLRWSAVDLDAGLVRVVEQLIRPARNPIFGPPKGDRSRTVAISKETVELLRIHRIAQNELKLRNRHHYRDRHLVFAKEWAHRTGKDHLGDPLQMNNLGQREFEELTKKAKVKRITFHGLRHTSATLLLLAGVSPKVVSERLGHKGIEITLDIYSHVLPSMQEDAAEKLAAILHG